MLVCRPCPLPLASPAARRPRKKMQRVSAAQSEVAESLHLLRFPEAATEASVGAFRGRLRIS